ncbi:MAG: hypothetical protein J1E41_01630 [Ruminococcus sp.]|nr:hypothetical protein [Ruminococcus sp.]
MRNTLFKVLSIDFDFFQNVTQRQLYAYPDGIDLAPELSDIVWGVKYMENGDLLRQINIDKTLLFSMIDIISNQKPGIPVMIANSHVHAHDFILKHCNDRKVSLINVDLHHDIISKNKKLDCGNWIKHLIDKSIIAKARWIGREISTEMYGFTDEDVKKMHLRYDFAEIESTQFDAVFLCRSDPWTPPHLDKYFNSLLDTIKNKFSRILIEERVKQPRDIPVIKTNIDVA